MEEGLKLVGEAFDELCEDYPEHKFHSYYTCLENKCTSLSPTEILRQQTEKKKDTKAAKAGYFAHKWLYDYEDEETGVNFLCYLEGDTHEVSGMYCLLCRRHHGQKKSEKFGSIPAVRMKTDAITTHRDAKDHTSSRTQELLQRVSIFHEEYEKTVTTRYDVIHKAFCSAFFLAQQNIANAKYVPLLEFLDGVGVDEISTFKHRSQGSIREIFLTIGATIKEMVLDRVQGESYGLLVDDMTDNASLEQMLAFIQYYDSVKEEADVAYLGLKDVLKDHDSANATALFNVLTELIKENDLDIEKLKGLTSDGAGVMLGKNNGLAAKLKRINPVMLAVHCVCHRLALACCDTSKELLPIKRTEEVLMQLWKWMDYSPKRMAAYQKIQLQLQNIQVFAS